MFAVCKYIHHRHYMYAVETLDITNTFFIGNVYHVYGVDTRNIPCIQLHLHLHDRYYLYVEETMQVPGVHSAMSVFASGELAYEGGEVCLIKENDSPAETSFLYAVDAVPRSDMGNSSRELIFPYSQVPAGFVGSKRN
ncbi:hypothetical protein M514_20901 [Trichuris suis]|uniref:Uncharacterized protein n=1 Tax=Trichuris suis TaxID=68888 RepID=A0A085NC39_9BILA|nr:hypothetical protein M514_20901 [Trichuris suis]